MSNAGPVAERIGKPPPTISAEGRPFWEGAKRHELRIQTCPQCQSNQFPPRVICGHCGNRTLNWLKVSGRAKIYSFTIIYRAPEPAFEADVPYVVAVVELDEGPRLMTNITGCQVAEVHVGMAVQAWFDDAAGDYTLVKFKSAGQ
jgi:uncharacterized OB-fold protein